MGNFVFLDPRGIFLTKTVTDWATVRKFEVRYDTPKQMWMDALRTYACE